MKARLFSVQDKIILASLYTIGKYSCENSYQYLDYITKTIAKSAKSLMSKTKFISIFMNILNILNFLNSCCN